MNYDLITKHLSKYYKDAERDKLYFDRWQKGNLKTDDCKYLFKNNNKIPMEDFEKIDDELFVNWLNSLGYERNN